MFRRCSKQIPNVFNAIKNPNWPACDGFKCGDGTCIEASQKCDKRADCADFTDELTCDPLPGTLILKLPACRTHSFTANANVVSFSYIFTHPPQLLGIFI